MNFNISMEPEIENITMPGDTVEQWRHTGRVTIAVMSSQGVHIFVEKFETRAEAEAGAGAAWRVLRAVLKALEE